MVERRDQVLIGRLSLLARAVSTFSASAGLRKDLFSMNVPSNYPLFEKRRRTIILFVRLLLRVR